MNELEYMRQLLAAGLLVRLDWPEVAAARRYLTGVGGEGWPVYTPEAVRQLVARLEREPVGVVADVRPFAAPKVGHYLRLGTARHD